MLSVAGWWVGVVHPVLYGTPGPSRPRFPWRDATLLHPLSKPQVAEGPAQAGISTGPGVSYGGGCVPRGSGGGGGRTSRSSRTSCIPRRDGSRIPRRDGSRIPRRIPMFFFMTTIKKRQCYPLCFF